MFPSRENHVARSNPGLIPGLLVAGLLLAGAQPLAAREAPPEPLEEVEAFVVGEANGTLVLPLGAPDRRTPAILVLADGEAPDGRAAPYLDQLLGAGLAVLEMTTLPGDSLEAVLGQLARHPRVLGERIGLLGFGLGARQVAALPEPVAARALLYPGCEGLAPAAMPGQAVLLMHGDADAANPAPDCARLGEALTAAGAQLRLRLLPGASYAWDRPAFAGEGHARLPRPDGAGRIEAQAWPEMAAYSAAEVAGFFATSLLGPRP
jgi:dienelactone hydrolase